MGTPGCIELAAGLAAGCQTRVGNYFANRAADLVQCFRLEVGLAAGVGGGVNLLGLVHTGVGGGLSTSRSSVGCDYGFLFAFRGAPGSTRPRDDRVLEAWFPFPIPMMSHPGPSYVGHLLFRQRARERGAHECAGWLPAIDALRHYAEAPSPRARWRAVHAFDVEAAVYAGPVHVHAGFSPGEFLDFLLGWFGVDFAGDDRALPAPDE